MDPGFLVTISQAETYSVRSQLSSVTLQSPWWGLGVLGCLRQLGVAHTTDDSN